MFRCSSCEGFFDPTAEDYFEVNQQIYLTRSGTEGGTQKSKTVQYHYHVKCAPPVYTTWVKNASD